MWQKDEKGKQSTKASIPYAHYEEMMAVQHREELEELLDTFHIRRIGDDNDGVKRGN